MDTLVKSELETNLITEREDLLNKLETLFKDIAIEAHLTGSVARQQADAYSDIDIWFTFKDEDFDEVYKNRFEYFKKLGDIIHFCEAPQNAPLNGVYSALLIRSKSGVILVVDICLCPRSTAYIVEEGRKLFGTELPFGVFGYNPKKVVVDKDYRIDFVICFIFNTIKKLARHEQNPLDGLLREYEFLYTNYNIPVEELDNKEQGISTLEKVIENIQKVANEKQKETLAIIRNFAKSVLG